MVLKRFIDTIHDGYGVGSNCTLGMSITHGIGSAPVHWHVIMITHLFAGRYAWYKRLCFDNTVLSQLIQCVAVVIPPPSHACS
jgi:hypothetical protein